MRGIAIVFAFFNLPLQGFRFAPQFYLGSRGMPRNYRWGNCGFAWLEQSECSENSEHSADVEVELGLIGLIGIIVAISPDFLAEL